MDSDELPEREDLSCSIKVEDFGNLMELMGTVYCEEEHRHRTEKLGDGGMISKNAFASWYMEWLFEDAIGSW